MGTIQARKRSPKHRYVQRQQLSWWMREIGELPVSEISPSLISQCKRRLVEQRRISGPTVNRYLAALGAVLRAALVEWEWIRENPLCRIRRNAESQGRIRFLSDDERTRLLFACKESRNPLLYPIVVLALSTGMRKGELLSLRWSAIDLERGIITLIRTKNGEIRRMPVRGLALELLREFEQDRAGTKESELIFSRHSLQGSKRIPCIRTAWEKAIERAGIADFRFHDLRHTFASYLAMNGASAIEIAELMGHKTLAMVKRYAHLSEGHVAKVVARMNERIFG